MCKPVVNRRCLDYLEKLVQTVETTPKFMKDFQRVKELLFKETLTQADKFELLNIYQVNYHEGGKIEGTFSADSSAHGCEFCTKMRELAAKDPTIICGLCYDADQEYKRPTVILRHNLNLLIISSVAFTLDEFKALKRIYGILRINSSGDIENDIHADNMTLLALANLDTAIVGLWAKNVPAVERSFDKFGKPANLIFVQSSPRIGIKSKRSKYADYVFTVYPDKKTLEAALKLGSMECNGRKCKECGYKCYYGLWPKGSDIAEYLRCSAKIRKMILASLASAEKRGIK